MHVTTSPSLVIRFPIDPMSEALVEVNQTIKASAELVAKETAIERMPIVEEEVKVDREDEGQTRELRGQSSFCPRPSPENFRHLVLSAEVVKGD